MTICTHTPQQRQVHCPCPLCQVEELEAENERLCGDLSLAKRALEDLAQENGRLKADSERIEFLERWVKDSRRRGFHYDTFTFKTDGPSVREQLDEQMKIGLVEIEKPRSAEPQSEKL